MFLQSFPGNVVNEAEVDITLPIMVNIVPSDSSLPFDVVVRFSVASGTATSKDTYYIDIVVIITICIAWEDLSICHTADGSTRLIINDFFV